MAGVLPIWAYAHGRFLAPLPGVPELWTHLANRLPGRWIRFREGECGLALPLEEVLLAGEAALARFVAEEGVERSRDPLVAALAAAARGETAAVPGAVERLSDAGRHAAAGALILSTTGDRDSCRLHLERADAVTGVFAAGEWIPAALGYARLLGDEGAARRSIKRAAEHAKTSIDWLHVALAWQSILGDMGEARKAVERLEAGAAKAVDLINLARAHALVLGDYARARALVDRAAADHEPNDSACLAGCRVWLFGDRQSAEALLRGAPVTGALAKAFRAHAWLEILGRRDEAHRLMREAVEEGGRTLPVGLWAQTWASMLGDLVEARNCLDRASESVKWCSEWASLAGSWVEVLGDRVQARQCLERGEAAARNSQDWSNLARGWSKALGDPMDARRCLARGEGIAERSRDWAAVAEAWTRVLADPREARRCLLQAESSARGASDWGEAAEGWMNALSDCTGARRCLNRAVADARRTPDWCAAADAAMSLGALDEAGGYLEVAEAAAANEIDRRLVEIVRGSLVRKSRGS